MTQTEVPVRKNKINVSFVDILLIVGCLGLLEMLFVKVFWEEILFNDTMRIFRRGQLIDKLTQFAIILGAIAFFNYLVGLFTAPRRSKALRNYLAVTFIAGLIIVFNLHYFF